MSPHKKRIEGLSPKDPIIAFFTRGVKEVKGDSPEGIGAKRRPLTSEGRQPLSLKKGVLEENMQQPQGTMYPDISEVRTLTGAATCNQLLAEGWVLLGIYPMATVGEMTQGGSRGEQEKQKQPQDTQRYVRRLVGYLVGKRRE
jgi:hypothetical protein